MNVVDGLTNGAECIIENIDYRVKDSTRPSIIWVSFPETSIGSNQRKEFAYLYNRNINKSWTPVLEITRQFKISKRHQSQVLRRQFPLRPAAAKTIHRCQGDTLNEAVVDLPSSSREHMHYVALSRVRNSSKLHILNMNEKKICVSQKVQEEMLRLREKSLLTCVPCLYNTNQHSGIKVLFHNVRSLHLHFDDVACDYNVQAADVNIFVETRLCSSDSNTDYEMNNFILFRNDFNPQSNMRTSYGTVVYVKNSIIYNCTPPPFRCNFNNVEITICIVNEPIPNLHIIFAPRKNWLQTVKKNLQNI